MARPRPELTPALPVGWHERGRPMRMAVVGSGISGLASAWLLSRRHDVHLFEREPRLGGHTYTVEIEDGGRTLALDTRLSRLQRGHVPQPGAALRPPRRAHADPPTCPSGCVATAATSSTRDRACWACSPSPSTWCDRRSCACWRTSCVSTPPGGRSWQEGRDPGQTLGEFVLAEGYSESSCGTTWRPWRPPSGPPAPETSTASRSSRCCASSPTTGCWASRATCRGAP